MVLNTGSSSRGELLMTRRTSEVAVCCSSASASSRVRASSCFFNSISELGSSLTCALAFVPVEQSLRPRVGLFAPLRDKITSAVQSLVPLPVGPAKGQPQPTNPNRTALNSRRLTRSPRRLLFAEREVMEYWIGITASVFLDVGRPDHLAPLLRFVGNEPAEITWRAIEDDAAEVGELRLQLGIGEAGIDLL